jgi:hypothetical protein
MKYIKKYKIFESVNLEEYIKDIFIELYDLGFDINIKINDNTIITIHKLEKVNDWLTKTKRFQFDNNIKELIIRLTHFMYENGFKKKFFSTNKQSKINIGNIRTKSRLEEYKGKEFVLRPDLKFRYTDGAWIDDNQEVMDIYLNFYK